LRPRPRLLLLAALAGSALPAVAEELPARRGPFEMREIFLLAQRRLTLSALSPDPLARGETRARLDLDWGNDFVRGVGRYFFDGEERALALTLRHGVTPTLTLGARLPLLWRGGGFLDRFADWIHKLGFPDNGRPRFPRDQLRVTAVSQEGRGIVWEGGAGTGLGRLELEAKLTALRRDTSRLAVALVGRAALPTGTGDFRGGGAAGAAQLAAAVGLGERWDGYAGAGLSFGGARRSEGFEYPATRGFAQLGVEWRFHRRWSALAQLDGGGRLLTNVEDYPGLQSYLRLGFKFDAGRRTTLEGAFSENLKNQQATTDFGVYMAVVRRF
jgi:hypothetical protein